jgi:Lar family restriction alleviation protein
MISPCPFCGGRAVSYPYETHRGEALIECQDCPARMSDRDETQLIAAWNRRSALSTLQVQTSEAVPIHDFTTTNPKETTMPKLTSKIAIQLVERIEALNDQIHAVYREAGEYDGTNNINLIREIVDARAAVADSKVVAEGLLESLDLPDNDA